MDDKATLYVCDPEKNTECKKTGCSYLLTKAEGGVCDATFKRECAKEYSDGKPMIVERRPPRIPTATSPARKNKGGKKKCTAT